jgi:hypothetical protein
MIATHPETVCDVRGVPADASFNDSSLVDRLPALK